jgi:hypothetical protein
MRKNHLLRVIFVLNNLLNFCSSTANKTSHKNKFFFVFSVEKYVYKEICSIKFEKENVTIPLLLEIILCTEVDPVAPSGDYKSTTSFKAHTGNKPYSCSQCKKSFGMSATCRDI